MLVDMTRRTDRLKGSCLSIKGGVLLCRVRNGLRSKM